MNINNLDLINNQNPYLNNFNNNIEDEVVYINKQNSIVNSDIIKVTEEENYLKYNKYTYEYNMNKNNSSTPNNPNLDGLNNLASLGLNLVGSFIDTATPLVQDFSNKMKEFEEKVNCDLNKPNTKNQTFSQKQNKPIIYQNEDDSYIYFVIELPRVKKEDCEIKYIKDENVIQVCGKTEPPAENFSFIENKEFEVKLKVPGGLNIVSNNIEASHKNGALYISISKSLINLNNININILS